MKTIKQFKGKYRWLSNFMLVEVVFEGIRYKSVEHAYQAAKSFDKEWRAYCATDITSGKVKRASRKVEIRANWEEVKVEVMNGLLKQKFSETHYRCLLLATGDSTIVEGNTWGDTFWGVDLKSGEGENNLGRLIMTIRMSLKKDLSFFDYWRSRIIGKWITNRKY